MRAFKLLAALLGSTSSVQADWLFGHYALSPSVSVITVTKTVHDDACLPTSSPVAISLTNDSVPRYPTSGPADSEDGTTQTKHTETVTYYTTYTTSTRTQTITVPGSTTSSTIIVHPSQSPTVSSSFTGPFVVVTSTVIVVPLSTPPAHPTSTVLTTSSSEDSTIFTTLLSTEIITVPGQSMLSTSSVKISTTAPYGNATSTSLASGTNPGSFSVSSESISPTGASNTLPTYISSVSNNSTSLAFSTSSHDYITSGGLSTTVAFNVSSSSLNSSNSTTPTDVSVTFSGYPLSSAMISYSNQINITTADASFTFSGYPLSSIGSSYSTPTSTSDALPTTSTLSSSSSYETSALPSSLDSSAIVSSSYGYPMATPPKLSETLSVSANSSTVQKRQLGATVTATIDGQVVTWINTYTPTTLIVWTTIPVATEPSGTPLSIVTSEFPSIAATNSEGVSSPSASGIPSAVSISSEIVPISTIIPSSDTSASMIGSSIPLSVTPTSWMTSLDDIPGPSSFDNLSTLPHQSDVSTPIIPVSSEVTSMASSPTATCSGFNAGRLVVNFDDLPTVSADENTKAYPPLNNPYRKLFWAQGFSYAPLPKTPYSPISGDHLGAFIVEGDANIHSQNFTDDVPSTSVVNGMFGAGPRYKEPAYWFEAYSFYIGCKNTGPESCDIRVSGFKYDEESGESAVRVRANFTQPPCASSHGCDLRRVSLKGERWKNLTAMQIVAYKWGTTEPISWFIDDLNLWWSDNSCIAVKQRDNSH